jgi:hypothetical protein
MCGNVNNKERCKAFYPSGQFKWSANMQGIWQGCSPSQHALTVCELQVQTAHMYVGINCTLHVNFITNWENTRLCSGLRQQCFNLDVQSIKGKFVPVLNEAPRHEDVLGSGGIAPHIFDLGTTWRWVVSFTPRPLYLQGKIPWYPLDRRLGGTQSRSGHGDEEKNSQPPPGIEP